jgi:streptogramin lyase
MKFAAALLLTLPTISLAQQIAIGEYLPNPRNFPAAIAPGPGGAVWFTATYAIGRVTSSGEITTFSLQGAPIPDDPWQLQQVPTTRSGLPT